MQHIGAKQGEFCFSKMANIRWENPTLSRKWIFCASFCSLSTIIQRAYGVVEMKDVLIRVPLRGRLKKTIN